MAGKKQAPAKFEDEGDDADTWEDSVEEADADAAAPAVRMRDWRDVERYREMKELRQLVDEDVPVDEIFENPLRPRAASVPVQAAKGAARRTARGRVAAKARLPAHKPAPRGARPRKRPRR